MFRIMSLKVKEGTNYVPELFDEQRDQVTVECILRVVFLDPDRANPALDKLKRQVAEADTAMEARQKLPPADTGPRVVGEGLVIIELGDSNSGHSSLRAEGYPSGYKPWMLLRYLAYRPQYALL